MEFKIDTKPTYVHITPLTERINANLTDALRQKCEMLTESGSENFIIDLSDCVHADKESFEDLVALHEYCYENAYSLVFTGLQEEVTKVLKDSEAVEILNIAPKMIEAIDIISMEILERDLFNEE